MAVRKNVLASAVACGIAVTGLAACSSPDDEGLAGESVEEIQSRAVSAIKSAKSWTMRADGRQGGRKMSFRVSASTRGDCTGSITASGATMRILKAGDASYMKPDSAFWAANAGGSDAAKKIRKRVGDRWVKLGPGQDTFLSVCDVRQFTSGMDKDKFSSEADKGERTEVGGTEAIPLTEKKDGATTTGYVALEGKPYILRMRVTGGEEPGTFTFSDFDRPVGAKAPAAGDTVDMAEITN